MPDPMLAPISHVRGRLYIKTTIVAKINSIDATSRLKQSLGLPKIQPRPPCPPKVYQKLYKFLDSALPAGTKRHTRALVLNKAELPPKSSSSIPKPIVKTIPSKQAIPRNRASRRLTAPVQVPEWVMPATRLLCQKLGAPAAPHHIFAGVSSILTLPASTESNNTETSMDATKKIPALIMIVFLTVYTRLTAMETPVDIFMDQKKRGFRILKDYMEQESVEEDEINDDDFDKLILLFGDRGWTQMDWFENITPGAGLGLDRMVEKSREVSSENEGATPQESILNFHDLDDNEKNYLQAGLGTMVCYKVIRQSEESSDVCKMQDKVDYLSKKRRLHYQEWKKGILVLIKELEQRDEMDQEAG